MKTAISISDELFESAEQFAGRKGMSRSELYAAAIQQYLREHRGEGVTERLDEIYGSEPGRLDPGLSQLQTLSLPKEEW
jgi:metal-responsive CopG/Arc/MetJ family transcriptional regulator